MKNNHRNAKVILNYPIEAMVLKMKIKIIIMKKVPMNFNVIFLFLLYIILDE